MTQKSVQNSNDFYALDRSAEEEERLQRQAQSRHIEEPTLSVLQHVGVQPGMACLDIGCGTGSVMEILGTTVGPTGTVTGLDVDSALGHKVVARLNTTGTSTFNFIEGDVRTIDQIPSESHDLTFARFLLLHLEDPGIVLQ